MSHSDSPDSYPQKAAPGPEQGRELNLVEFPASAPDSAPPTHTLSSSLISAALLNDIVERAKITTNASDAAIALRQGDDIVCLAATGSAAPDIGARLDRNSGLSGACAQSKSFQRCDDSETDARVDAAVCQRLGVRSALVFPILRGNELLGIVEVFSPKAHAFGDREVQALASLSRTIGYILERSAETAPPPEASDEIPAAPVPEASPSPAPEPAHRDEPQASAVAEVEAPRQDYWTTALTLMVIVLAITLGWLLGRGGLRLSGPAAQNSASGKTASPEPKTNPAPAPAGANPSDAKAQAVAPSGPKHEAVASQTPPSGGLVISEKGKVIYREPGPQPSSVANARPEASSSVPGWPGISNAVLVSPETANRYLVHRVEPQYPEQARKQHIEGPVTLEAVVGKDGSVKALKTISGDPQLATAARRAVRQWRFKPLLQDGKAAEFQTKVTVNFRLP